MTAKQNAKEYVQGSCAVCVALDDNNEIKEVAWCNTCQVHICKSCDGNWIRRGAAFLEKVRRTIIKK